MVNYIWKVFNITPILKWKWSDAYQTLKETLVFKSDLMSLKPE